MLLYIKAPLIVEGANHGKWIRCCDLTKASVFIPMGQKTDRGFALSNVKISDNLLQFLINKIKI